MERQNGFSATAPGASAKIMFTVHRLNTAKRTAAKRFRPTRIDCRIVRETDVRPDGDFSGELIFDSRSTNAHVRRHHVFDFACISAVSDVLTRDVPFARQPSPVNLMRRRLACTRSRRMISTSVRDAGNAAPSHLIPMYPPRARTTKCVFKYPSTSPATRLLVLTRSTPERRYGDNDSIIFYSVRRF